jgi:ribonuclease P protein component
VPGRGGCFPRERRVRKRVEYQQAQRIGRRVSTPSFVLILAARGDETGARLGTVASRKIGGAVARNRAKRLIREAFRRTDELFPPDMDVIVIVKRALDGAVLDDVLAEWRSAAPVIVRRSADARRVRAARATATSAGEAPEKTRDSGTP